MYKKEDLRIVKTKRNLYEGLLFMMKEKPFEEIKVSDICKEALTNRSTFYDHFNDKYELLVSLIEDLKYELTEKLKENKNIETPKQYYMEMIHLLLDHIEENSKVYSSIIKYNSNTIASDMFKQTLLKDVAKQIESFDTCKKNIPAEIITLFYVSAVINVCMDYIRSQKKYRKEEILTYLDTLIPDTIYE